MNEKPRNPEDCLVVAADFAGNSRSEVKKRVMSFARKIRGTGVIIKVNSVLRAVGYDLIDRLHDLGLKVFADLKLNDISNTLGSDAVMLWEARPEIATAMCNGPIAGLERLRRHLPSDRTELLGVTVLTDYTNGESLSVYRRGIKNQAAILAARADAAGFGGIVLSAKENAEARRTLTRPMSLNNPAVRPSFSIVAGDDQNPDRIVTPLRAIGVHGASRIIVGRPIVEAPDPLRAVQLTLEEISLAL